MFGIKPKDVIGALDQVDPEETDGRLIAGIALAAGVYGLRRLEQHSRGIYGEPNRAGVPAPRPEPRKPARRAPARTPYQPQQRVRRLPPLREEAPQPNRPTRSFAPAPRRAPPEPEPDFSDDWGDFDFDDEEDVSWG